MTDDDVRVHIYERFVETGAPPSVVETAAAFSASADQVAAAYRRLEEARVIVLAPGTTNVWMANPLSAVPTPFRVETGGREYWGNCVWDALGVVSMLGGDGVVHTACADCGDPFDLRVETRELQPVDAVVHFAVPAARWWDNIGYT